MKYLWRITAQIVAGIFDWIIQIFVTRAKTLFKSSNTVVTFTKKYVETYVENQIQLDSSVTNHAIIHSRSY